MADPQAASSRPEPQPQDTGRDFGRLSRRIAGWTTNCLATALVILAGLTLGRQVLIWWRETPEAPPAADARDRPTSPEAEQRQLEFGALATTVQTRQVRGSRQELLRILREMCRPASRPGSRSTAPAEPAERRLLAELAGKDPAESGDGWRIDELPQGMPLVICSTSVPRTGTNSDLPAPLDPRIVSIGLAVPGGQDQWTAYAFQVDGASPAAANDAAFPLPEGSRKVMALRQADESILTTFRGISEAAVWEQHFRRVPPEMGWRLVGNPPQAKGHWQAEFVREGPKPLRAQVHFEYDGQGGLNGLSLVSPAGKL
jgi:hypothetical protein